jgi:RNA-binding protein
MDKLSSHQRRFLKGQAHSLEPVILVGKQGISDSLIKMTNTALNDHELIKIKFVDLKDKKKILIEEIGNRTGSQVVGIIGHITILFRQHADKEKRKIKLPQKK